MIIALVFNGVALCAIAYNLKPYYYRYGDRYLTIADLLSEGFYDIESKIGIKLGSIGSKLKDIDSELYDIKHKLP